MEIESGALAPLIITDEPTVSQWLDMHRSSYQTPEHKLMFAVLDDAINDYLQYCNGRVGSRQKKYYDDAKYWLFVGDGIEPFTYETICETLGINQDWLRKGLRAAAERGMMKGPRRNLGVRDVSKNAQ